MNYVIKIKNKKDREMFSTFIKNIETAFDELRKINFEPERISININIIKIINKVLEECDDGIRRTNMICGVPFTAHAGPEYFKVLICKLNCEE
jgi:hypothetical protein